MVPKNYGGEVPKDLDLPDLPHPYRPAPMGPSNVPIDSFEAQASATGTRTGTEAGTRTGTGAGT
eukprot:242471-Pelagomonas_calceolata.AAC.1